MRTREEIEAAIREMTSITSLCMIRSKEDTAAQMLACRCALEWALSNDSADANAFAALIAGPRSRQPSAN